MPTKVLLPVDGGHQSRTAEEYAVKLNEMMPIKVVLLHVINTKDIDGRGIDPGLKETIVAAKMKNGEKALTEAAEVLKRTGIEFEKKRLSGDPAALICYEALSEHFDLVLMAESGRSDFQEWYMGGVTSQVLNRCRVPVLLVKHPRG